MFVLNELNKSKYNVIETHEIKEQNLEVVELCHLKTKAKLVLLICEDENRVFNIAFKTPVFNSKGTPHILEHSVLCGSRKYDVKDPFIELAKGSLNTFLNAMTFPDKTCYPVASANLKDFHNLMDVYLDAVFYPNVINNDKLFKQEGWHYEINDIKDDLQVNGVVYNEMKGVYSDPDSILESAVLKNLYADTNYAYDYGGNPVDIIDLNYDEFVEFHKKYYSATNSIIYLYGKLDYNDELDRLDRDYLSLLDEVNVDAKFLDVNSFKKDKEQVDYYNVDTDDNDEKSYISYSFSLDYPKTSFNNIIMQIINYVLFSSDSAILKEKLLNEGYGESVFAKYTTEVKNGLYSVVLQNVNEKKKDNFIKLFNSFIQEMIDKGLDIDKFKAGINSLYFEYAEGEYGRVPRGLIFSLVSLDTYLYGGKPYTFIEYKDVFDQIKKIDLNNKNNAFISMLKEVFIDNKHKCINVLSPKKNYSIEKEKQLADRLSDRKNKFSEDDIKNIIEDTRELKKFQLEKDTEEALKCIPMLSIGDIDKYKKMIDYEVESNEGIDTVLSYDNDKDIVYIEISFDISDLKSEELYLFSIINNIISKIDLETMSFNEFNNYVDINTGGLIIKIDIYENKTMFTLKIKVVDDRIDYAFDILFKLLAETKFVDSKRIEILLNECKSNSLLEVMSSGHVASSCRARSDIEYSCGVSDKVSTGGIGFYKFINSLCKVYGKDSSVINETLDALYKELIHKRMYLLTCTNKKYHDRIVEGFNNFKKKIDGLKAKNKVDSEKLSNNISKIKESIAFDTFDKKSRTEAIVTPNDVNFCALAGTFDAKYYDGKLSVLKVLFNYEYLWTNIRVLGGAYGCMSQFSKTGVYTFASYRDPNVSNTNKVFREVRDFLNTVNKKDSEVEKYIIGAIGNLDNPKSVVDKHNRNVAAYFNSLDDKYFNKIRTDILSMKAKDLNVLAKVFEDIDNGSKCALICANKIEEAQKEYDDIWQLMD